MFEQPSTRTRTSFEAGVIELGGHPMVLRPDEMQLTRGESIRDTAPLFAPRGPDRAAHRATRVRELNGFAECRL